jgi:hypothetical protein
MLESLAGDLDRRNRGIAALAGLPTGVSNSLSRRCGGAGDFFYHTQVYNTQVDREQG